MHADSRHVFIQTHQKNIARLHRLLTTDLTEHERRYLHSRIAEERAALERLRNRIKLRGELGLSAGLRIRD